MKTIALRMAPVVTKLDLKNGYRERSVNVLTTDSRDVTCALTAKLSLMRPALLSPREAGSGLAEKRPKQQCFPR